LLPKNQKNHRTFLSTDNKEVSNMATFWDKRSEKYDDNIQKHDSLYDKTIQSTRSLLTDSDIVLDFACASGEMSLDIVPYVQHIYGIDLSVKMIELANQKAHDRQVDNIKFDPIDVFDQKLTSQPFSAIVAFNIFHLLEDAPKYWLDSMICYPQEDC
jgi:ubiquinone/menaquinone biosynthesis C-methylase UbiE